MAMAGYRLRLLGLRGVWCGVCSGSTFQYQDRHEGQMSGSRPSSLVSHSYLHCLHVHIRFLIGGCFISVAIVGLFYNKCNTKS